MSAFVIIIVPADGLALLGVGAFGVTVMLVYSFVNHLKGYPQAFGNETCMTHNFQKSVHLFAM